MRMSFLAAFTLMPILLWSQSKTLYRYSADAAAAEIEIESQFDTQLKASNLDEWMKYLSGRPHHLGSVYGRQSAEYIRDHFKSWGYEAEIETYKVLFPTPKVRILELVAPTKFKAGLTEPALKEDKTSNQTNEQLPTYNAWSADGDVTGDLVFVNYGVPSDYEELERLGIDVKGKIVIAKYGGSWRGIKPKVAQEHGAIGCLIYSDPKEEGYFQGDVYPTGPYRNKYGAQRGSVVDLPVQPGDPSTPGVASLPDSKRVDHKDSENLLKIPVQPISYADAEPLLRALGGPVVPENWRGSLPFTYKVGPGPAKVHLKLTFDWKFVDCHNVIAKMKGSEFPDEWVVRGNHHDAWVNGANDPISGMVALMEEARAMSELVKTGWRPKRTLVYCAWDGEEPGLIGSTEWVEHHAEELQQKVVTYINSDSNGRGFLYAGGSHALEQMMGEVARDITDPQTGIPLLERTRAAQAARAGSTASRKTILDKKTMSLGALGSGSDYSPFFQHLGIPSLNIGFGGEDDGGEYHSIYDSYDLFVRFKDPGFEYGVALAKVAGRATLRLANATTLPFDFIAFHSTVSGYLNEVTSLIDNMRESTDVENRMIKSNYFVYAQDPKVKYVPPVAKSPVPYLDFSPIQNAMQTLKKASSAYSDIVASGSNSSNGPELNRALYQAEQKLMVASGLPRRPWYKHTIYSPGYYTGYGVKTLPGIREAIEQRNWSEAQEQIQIAAKALVGFAAEIEKATRLATTN
ncbi:transferrin receptor-like dimerization domain-containing protein [Chryseolinea sp. T2]|uniref:transferrin receptor-like dimerization domain-containing protein n=1 Tax=Chryseolinea sp. T2 TaxID=3129255 RepID=UPI0030777AFA